MIYPRKVIKTLTNAKVKFFQLDPCGEGEIVVLVREKEHEKTVRALRVEFPNLELKQWFVESYFHDPGTKEPVISIKKPVHPLFKTVFRCSIPVSQFHWLPDLEMGLVWKFGFIMSPDHEPKQQLIDREEFAKTVKSNQGKIKLKKLERLGDKVFTGGGQEIVSLVKEIEAARRLLDQSCVEKLK